MRAALEAHLGSQQIARIVYGSIVGLTLVVALDDHPPAAGVMVAWLLLTALAVALAELYSEVVGAETRERHRVTRHQLAHMLDGAGAVAFGVAFPAAYFALSMIGLIGLETAFTVAKWGGLALLGFYGYWASRFAGASVVRALLRAALVAAIGGALISVKALLK